MDILSRILTFVGGMAVGFAGYFLMAAEGWPPPFQDMVLERGVVGGLILLLGLALIWTAFKPMPRKAPASHAPAPRDIFTLAPGPAATVSPPQAPAEPSHHASPPAPVAQEHEPEAAPAHEAEQSAPAPLPQAEGLTKLMAQGDRLFAEGRLDEALDPYSQALDLARDAHDARPHDAEATRALAAVLKSNADVYDEEGRLDSAIELYEEALKLNRGLAASGSAGDKRILSLVLERLGDCRESRGHRSRAADLYRESLAIAEELARGDPDNPLYAEDLAVTRRRLLELEGETETV
jgi:tetratricopeptide (TPR) repeat protein